MDQPVLWKVDGCSAACFSFFFFWVEKAFYFADLQGVRTNKTLNVIGSN